MELHKLAVFVDLAQTLNFSTTAARLFTSQATVSKQIKALEKELDASLFDRSHRQIKLTAAGKLVLPYARSLLATEKQMLTALAAQQDQVHKRLVLRAIPSIAQYKAFNLIAAFAKQHPEIDLQFAEAESDTLLPALDAGRVDIVFTRLFGDEAAKYATIIGETDHFAALLPKNHPFATAASVSVQALAEDSFLLLSDATYLYQPVMAMLKAANIEPKIAYTGQRIDLIAGMVNRGMGVSIMMAHAFDALAYPNVVAVPITPVQNSQLAFLRSRGEHTLASDAFWTFCQARIR
ncbi:LysR family transcriptional regulator [Lacticaseibacillus baoqingensis]|uniref:LysR family transcriptional regulator n=1 Tax=Lacticaseibacillus baoqingensis TaxID=2486013 RepID=A0ABW4E658_9LACO|nr:LysR family transcriptional regulator [Lacticaseibacillus baoqingensis]